MPQQHSLQGPQEGPVRLGGNGTDRPLGRNHLTARLPKSVSHTEYGSPLAASEGNGGIPVSESPRARLGNRSSSNGRLPRSSLRARQDSVASSDLYTWVDHAASCRCGDCEMEQEFHEADCQCSDCGWEDEDHAADCPCGHCKTESEVEREAMVETGRAMARDGAGHPVLTRIRTWHITLDFKCYDCFTLYCVLVLRRNLVR